MIENFQPKCSIMHDSNCEEISSLVKSKDSPTSKILNILQCLRSQSLLNENSLPGKGSKYHSCTHKSIK